MVPPTLSTAATAFTSPAAVTMTVSPVVADTVLADTVLADTVLADAAGAPATGAPASAAIIAAAAAAIRRSARRAAPDRQFAAAPNDPACGIRCPSPYSAWSP